jgi:hypothetical protein
MRLLRFAAVRESPLQRGLRVAFIGAVPASLLLAAALLSAPSVRSGVEAAWLVAVVLGTVGLWLAVVLDPRVVAPRTSVTAVLLVCGLAASWPTYVALASIVAEPAVPSLRTLGSGDFWLAIWLFLGPVVSALIYCGQHGVAVIHGRDRASNNSFERARDR